MQIKKVAFFTLSRWQKLKLQGGWAAASLFGHLCPIVECPSPAESSGLEFLAPHGRPGSHCCFLVLSEAQPQPKRV